MKYRRFGKKFQITFREFDFGCYHGNAGGKTGKPGKVGHWGKPSVLLNYLLTQNHNSVVGRYKRGYINREYSEMLEITCNDRLGKKVRVKCNPDDTIGDLKKLIAAQTGTHWEKIVLKKWYTIFKDHIKLQDYEIHDGMNLELYYQ